MIRKFLEAAESGRESVPLWGDGSPTREFLYVEDAAEGIVAAAEQYDGEAPVNLGTGEMISIADLAALIAELTGYTGSIEWDKSSPGGQPLRQLDTSRAKALFGFTAGTSLRDGLQRTVEWYRASRAT